jgi:DnaJ-class molecular chaperone
MARDPYDVLGVARTATQDEIQKAYRKIAKKAHPDLHPGDKAAEERFKEINVANDILGDPDKRRRFDAGEIDAAGAERPPERRFYRDFAGGPEGGRYAGSADFGGPEDLEDLFAGIFGARPGRAGAQPGGPAGNMRFRGGDVSYTLEVSLLDAANGASRTVSMPDGRALEIRIPAGVRDRQMLRLKGQGEPGFNGGEPGDAYVEIHIRPHAVFERKDQDIHIRLPITLGEAVLGGRVEVPTVTGSVAMNVPAGANTGTTLRLKGKGMPGPGGTRGDQYVHLQVVLPKAPDRDLADFVADWADTHPYDPRADLMKGADR